MTRAFIVKLNVDDVSLLVDAAADVEDTLIRGGLDVISVAPWKGHGIMLPEPQPVPPPTI